MHPNPVFRRQTRDENLAFARKRGFGILAVNGESGPQLAHVPFVLDDTGQNAALHLVRSNPIWRQLTAPLPAVIAVSGPDAYISPDWYGIIDQVPTWNYVAVHLRGTLSPLPPGDLPGILDRLSADFEARLAPKPPWTAKKMTADVRARMMRMIVPCAFQIESVDGTWKLGQNKSTDARNGAVAGLSQSPVGQQIRELSEMMNKIED